MLDRKEGEKKKGQGRGKPTSIHLLSANPPDFGGVTRAKVRPQDVEAKEEVRSDGPPRKCGEVQT